MQIYKPNPRNLGHAISVEVQPDKESVFISFIKQATWDDTKKTGTFSANRQVKDANVSLKFNEPEIAGIIDAIESSKGEFSFYHTNPQGNTAGKFRLYYGKTNGVEDINSPPKGFSFSAIRDIEGNKVNFLIGLTFAEAILVREFLKFALVKIFEFQQSKRSQKAPKAVETKAPEENATQDW